jgi:hypothetical protein
MIYFIGFIINVLISFYTYYFLSKVRFYPCVMEVLKKNINFWSWLIVFFGVISAQMPAYSLRAYFIKDSITDIAFIFQVIVLAYGILLFYFHIKTTSNEKVV